MALLTALLGTVAAISHAGTVTLTVSDGLDDAYAWGASSQNNSADDARVGYNASYAIPYYIGAFRFVSVPLTNGTEITSATLRTMAYLSGTGASSLLLQGEAYDSTDSYDAANTSIGNRAVTTAQVSWPVAGAWLEDSTNDSPDIATIVQEIVDRPGWSSGNAMAIQLRNTATSGGYQYIYTKENAAYWQATPVQLIINYVGDDPPNGVKSENYIPGATNSPSSVPTYLNNPTMYYPASGDGICWAVATADILAYWDRVSYSGVQYWNLIDHGLAPLLQPSVPSAPGHDQADVWSTINWFAHQYYGLSRSDEDVMIEEYANDTTNNLAFNATYHGPVSSEADRTTFLGIIKTEIDAGRPISIGSWGTYFGGAHQVPVIGYKERSNTVDSTVYIHRNTGGTQSEYVNFYSATWGSLDMDQIVPAGTPVDSYEPFSDDSAATTVTIDPDDTYNFRQTHNFDAAPDQDWMRLGVVSGSAYRVSTTDLGLDCDTVVTLFRSNGVSQIAQDDDGGSEPRASELSVPCWQTGTWLVRVTNAGTSGHRSNYDIEVSYGPASNDSPTDIQLSNALVPENCPAGETVGILSATDPDPGNTFTYALVSGAGSSGNGDFAVDTNVLATAAVFNYESQSNYSVRIRATDQGGLWYEEPFTISISNIVEAPPCLSNVQATSEGIIMQWESIPTHTYGVYECDNLVTGQWILIDTLPATPPNNSYTGSVGGLDKRFWKITTGD